MKNLALVLILVLTFVNITYSQNPVILYQLSDGLVAYYPFSGNAMDASGNNFDGFVSGARLTSDLNGNPYNAYLFNGYSDYIDFGIHEKLQIRGDLTIGVWMNANQLNTITPTLVSCVASNTDDYETNALYKIGFRHGRNTIGYIHESGFGINHAIEFTEYAIDLHKWYHVVVIRNSTEKQIILYINGEFIGTRSYLENPDGGSLSGLRIGETLSTIYPGRHFDGIIDEIVLFNRALIKNEIKLLYNSEKKLSADFIGDATWGEVPLTVNFTDRSSAKEGYEITSWMWDFNNDEVIDSYEQNPNWVFTERGSYDITLIVSSDTTESMVGKKEYISVTGNILE